MNSVTRQAIKDEAERRGWVFEEVDSEELYFKVTDRDGRSTLGRGGRFMGSSANGVSIAINKALTYEVVASYGYRLPDFLLHKDDTESRAFLARHSRIVVKPATAEKSRGVTADVTTDAELDEAIVAAARETKKGRVILQQQLEGKLYRVLIIGGQLFAASYRRAAFVIGNGISTIEELIAEKNCDPLRHQEIRPPLAPIRLDDARRLLGDDGLRAVLPLGQEHEVSAIASVSRGGEAMDVTDDVHPDLRRKLEEIAVTLRLDVCGYDIMMDDIADFDGSDYLPLLEINSMPGYKLHLYPTAGGEVRDPAPAILDLAFGLPPYDAL